MTVLAGILTNTNVEKVFTARRAGLRRVRSFPATTHNILLLSISCHALLLDEIAATFISYAQRCLSSGCEICDKIWSVGWAHIF